MDNFAVFILTHGRPDRVYTYKTLRSHGYTGDIYLVIDDEDETENQYRQLYGDQVIIFSKAEIEPTIDFGDNLYQKRKAVLYARNAVFDIAESIGVEYFLVLDDDYHDFRWKFDQNLEYRDVMAKNLDAIFEAILDYYKSIPALTLALSQSGDFIGGRAGTFGKCVKLKRKAMNAFFCSIKRRFKFFGRINEDVNAYVTLGSRGDLFLTTNHVAVFQKQTQSNPGGLTDIYLDLGTYVKSFYSVMYSPSCVKVAVMGDGHDRLHHRISWNNAVPKILSGRFASEKS